MQDNTAGGAMPEQHGPYAVDTELDHTPLTEAKHIDVQYPEHAKLDKVKDRTQACGEFLEWLDDNGYVLARYDDEDQLYPVFENTQDLLGRAFGVDPKKLEQEKRAMLESIRHGLGGL